jgi:lysyl-tRNA synthetase class 2
VAEREILTPTDVLRAAATQTKVRVAGRILSREGSDIVVCDACARLTVHTARDLPIGPGYWVVFDGTWDGARLKKAELIQSQACPAPKADGEFARLAFDGVGPRLARRAEALKIARRYFDEQSFVEVETPTRLRAPGLDANVEPIESDGGWLSTSPELHLKRLIVGGMPRMFEFARCHRAEELGTYHEPEFTLLEWYRAFESVESVMRDAEALVRKIIQALSGQSQLKHREFTVQMDQPFVRLSVAEAMKIHAGIEDGLALAEHDPDRWFHTWVDQVEPALASYPVPIFVIDYPVSQAALARRKPADPSVAERFELYCAGVELCNGFGELTDPDEQQARFEAELSERRKRDLPLVPLDQRFLNALREGMPTCSGNALGFDRLVMLATGANTIADVQAFPWNRN